MSEFRLVRAREAAKIMAVSVRQFYRMKVPAVKWTEKARRRWDVRDLEEFAERRKSRKVYARTERVA